MARFSNASQRARPHLHAASSAVVALTLMFTFFTVRHLAGAIAVRRSLANSGELEVRGHKLLSDTTYVVEEGRPHWLSDGSIRKTADSIRGKSPLRPVWASLKCITQTWCWLQCHCRKALQSAASFQQGDHVGQGMSAPYSSNDSVWDWGNVN